jgi:hypothetical protein
VQYFAANNNFNIGSLPLFSRDLVVCSVKNSTACKDPNQKFPFFFDYQTSGSLSPICESILPFCPVDQSVIAASVQKVKRQCCINNSSPEVVLKSISKLFNSSSSLMDNVSKTASITLNKYLDGICKKTACHDALQHAKVDWKKLDKRMALPISPAKKSLPSAAQVKMAFSDEILRPSNYLLPICDRKGMTCSRSNVKDPKSNYHLTDFITTLMSFKGSDLSDLKKSLKKSSPFCKT